MKYHLRPALRCGRAVDVPSALSIDREHGREGMPGGAPNDVGLPKNSLSRVPHGHLHVNWEGFSSCATAPNPIEQRRTASVAAARRRAPAVVPKVRGQHIFFPRPLIALAAATLRAATSALRD